jgi:hypothetical protein
LLATEVPAQQVFARVAHETGLLGDNMQKRRSPAHLSTVLCGVRADRMEQAHLILAARVPDYEPDVLNRAWLDRKSVVRTWGVKGNVQIIPTIQLGLYLAAAGITAPRWRRFLDARSNLTTPARLRLLKRLGPEVLTRDNLREAIPDATTRSFMLREAAQNGALLWKEGDGQMASYVWTEAWLERAVEPDREYHELVGRYLTSYGPVEAADLAAWLGVTVAAARRLMAKHLVEEVRVEGEDVPTFMKAEDLRNLQRTRKSGARGVLTLPPGDPVLLAYKTRYRGEGDNDEAGAVFIDGRLAGLWTLNRATVALQPLEPGNRGKMETGVRQLLERAQVRAEIPG